MLRLLVLLIALTLAAPALAQTAEEVDTRLDTVLGSHVLFEEAYVDLSAAIEADNADALSELMVYGTPFKLNGKDVTLADAAEFKLRIGEFFNDKVKAAVKAQRYETLFVNADGVMFGVGQLWLGAICKDEVCTAFDVKIIAFNNG
ncbi:MAG: hypothetical protein ABL866_02850 [Devosia sp.]